MKRILFLLWLAVSPLMAAAQSYQTPEVQVSSEKANIGGKVYYVHKVLAKQTVFSICKAYGIKSDELAAANPDIKDGLKAGSIIFIPAGTAQAADSTSVKAEPDAAETAAEPDENVSGDDGGEANPISRVVEHRVRWYESIKTIARKYGVTVNDIIAYNGLDSQHLSSGKVILIPLRDGVAPDDTAKGDVGEPGKDNEGKDENESPEDPMMPVRRHRWFSAEDPIDIALILPINATAGTPSASFLNFYSGALMAVEEQKERGAHIVVNVYDLAQGSESILSDKKFAESDLIVGPVEASTMKAFLEYSDLKGIPFVSPLDHKADSLADTHPFFFQVPASSNVQAQNLAGSLRFHPRDRVFLVHSNTTGEDEFLKQIEDALMNAGISYRKSTSSDITSQVSSVSRSENPAKIIIGSENKVFASEVIRLLNVIAKKNVPMEVYFTNRVRNYETSDPEALFNIAAHIPAPYFVDYSNPEDQSFVLRYRALFSSEPDDFAFQGHDVLTYFIAAMTKLGTAICDNADSYPMQLLHCNFFFRRDNEKSGWRNHATRNIVYSKEDYSIKLSK